MPLLFPPEENYKEEFSGSDAATRSLSAISLETSFVEEVYTKMASVYDLIFGITLHHGRTRAIQRMALGAGDQLLEVGVGTGIGLPLYPRHASVTGIDFSESMLDHARARVDQHDLHNVRLIQMDATKLTFPDDSFDVVYAPYFINCVPDPLAATAEMKRVCRPGGRLVFLSHFLSRNPVFSRVERAMAPITPHFGFKSDFDLPAFLAQSGLRAASIEKVNMPRIWSIVICPNGQ